MIFGTAKLNTVPDYVRTLLSDQTDTMSEISDTQIDYAYMIKHFASENGMVMAKGLSFDNCSFRGPWVASPILCKLTKCRIFRQGTAIKLTGQTNATGLFVFDDCLFNNCTFDLVQFAGDSELVEQIPNQTE